MSDRPSRCCYDICKGKINIVDFPCKCKNYYCSKHRHAEQHNCSYDYKGAQTTNLLKHLSTSIIAQKIAQL